MAGFTSTGFTSTGFTAGATLLGITRTFTLHIPLKLHNSFLSKKSVDIEL